MSRPRSPFRPALEGLEDRTVPYALTGTKWANVNVSASFMPDGATTVGGVPSTLFARLDAIAPTATWQREVARALQTWASVSPLNFRIVPDSGAASGVSGSTQGDSRFGDIRFGAYQRSDSYIAYAYFPGGGTLAGDAFLNSGYAFGIGSYPDLYSVLLHETGHSLGLDHSSVSGAVMYPRLAGQYTGLSADDIAGIQAIYGVRKPDGYDAGAPNDGFAAATPLSLNSSGAVALSADLTTLADVDYFRITAPTNFNGTLTVSVDARALSLLAPKVLVYDAAGNLVGTAAANYGGAATLTLGGLTAGATYYVVADGATDDVFGMGAYKLSAQFSGTTSVPQPPSLSAASSSTVTVQYSTADGTATAGSDYAATSGTLSFAPGETRKTVTVAVTGDTVPEADETFFINLSNPVNAVLGTAQGQGTILNDDVPPDRYEVNDTPAAATNFGRTDGIAESGLTLHTATDADYYGFTLNKKGTYTVKVEPVQGTGTLNVMILSAEQAAVASGQSQGGSVTMTVYLGAGQQYYLRVTSETGSVLSYSLTVAKGGGRGGGGVLAGEEIGDGFEARPGPWYVPPLPASAADPARAGSTTSTPAVAAGHPVRFAAVSPPDERGGPPSWRWGADEPARANWYRPAEVAGPTPDDPWGDWA